jgi:uncharacterized coiled-coil protein SlyX
LLPQFAAVRSMAWSSAQLQPSTTETIDCTPRSHIAGRGQSMTDIEKRIAELECKAAESSMLAELATSAEARLYNKRLAIELSELAQLERDKAKDLQTTE